MNLSTESLDFALKHITNFYDSDFFVRPFEFQAISTCWDEVKNYIQSNTIEEIDIYPPLTYAAPKHSNGFRIVHQLEPINAIILTALVHSVSEQIEANRFPIESNSVCSYRVELDESGGFFKKGSGFNNFLKRSEDLSDQFNYVLITDITDFYNQIYLHRLQNSIESCSDDFKEISKTIEKFLSKINNTMSKGIPVGPAASIILAEASLIDVDQFIQNNNFHFTRYVDDFRIYSNSKIQLLTFLEKLSYYLYSNHRLTLSGDKTEILSSDGFKKKYINDPERLYKDKLHKSLEEIRLCVNEDYPSYEPIEIEELPPEHQIRIQGESLRELLDEIIKLEKLDLGLARHILRRAGRLRTRSIYKSILTNFDFFTPVIRDVGIYLDRVTNNKTIEHNIADFINIIKTSEGRHLKFVKYWLDYIFSKYPKFTEYKEIQLFINKESTIRNKAFQARQQKNIAWVRDHKNRLIEFADWDARAIIFSSSVLSKDERDKWMTNIIGSNRDILLKIIAKHMKSI